MSQFTSALALCAVGAVAFACNDQPTEPVPPSMTSAATLPTEGVPGWQLADTPKVVLLNDQGRPVAGIEVVWTVREGGGSVAPVNAVTDADGISAAVWTLGPVEGTNLLRASVVVGEPVDFQVTGAVFSVDKLVADNGFACGLRSGALWCWGPGYWAGSAPVSVPPTIGASYAPSLVDDTHGFIDVAVAGPSVCGLDPQGLVWCASAQAPTVAQVPGLPAVRQLAGAILGFTYLRPPQYCGTATADSTAWCWTLASPPARVTASPPLRAVWISRGKPFGGAVVPYSDYRACGLRGDSTAACWGIGPAGDGLAGSGLDSAVMVSGGHRFTELVVGDRFTCGRTPNEEVWCWGGGVGSTASVPELSRSGAKKLAGFGDEAQALGSLGAMTRWYGPTGQDLHPPTGSVGLPVSGFAFNSSLCIRLAGGEAYCGELESPTSDLVYSPVQPVREIPLTTQRQVIIDRKAD